MTALMVETRVKLSTEGEQTFPRWKGRAGVLERYKRDGTAVVVFDGRITPVELHPDFLVAVDAAVPT